MDMWAIWIVREDVNSHFTGRNISPNAPDQKTIFTFKRPWTNITLAITLNRLIASHRKCVTKHYSTRCRTIILNRTDSTCWFLNMQINIGITCPRNNNATIARSLLANTLCKLFSRLFLTCLFQLHDQCLSGMPSIQFNVLLLIGPSLSQDASSCPFQTFKVTEAFCDC